TAYAILSCLVGSEMCIRDSPYAFHVDPQVYKDMVEEIKRFLNGGHTEIQKQLEEKMKLAAADMEFEKAAKYRDQIR
ncbi:UvrB/UvrC motif-containing protein, partial [Enterococcus sp. S181_ASV_20]|nr:UvrB/UvrC motif-containing protein [Enterococcus sp. S181_ASV_20]